MAPCLMHHLMHSPMVYLPTWAWLLLQKFGWLNVLLQVFASRTCMQDSSTQAQNDKCEMWHLTPATLHPFNRLQNGPDRTERSSVGLLARWACGGARVRFLGIATRVSHRILHVSPGSEVVCVLVCVRVWGGVRKSRYDAFWDFSDSLVCAESGQCGHPKFLHDSPVLLGAFKKRKKKERCWPRLESACKSTLQKVVTGRNIRFYPFLDLPNELIKWII